jgi:serine/threonine protein kinase
MALNFDHFYNSLRNVFKHELTLLEKVRHPNVVQFVGAVTQNIPMMIVREYHAKVTLTSASICIGIIYFVWWEEEREPGHERRLKFAR